MITATAAAAKPTAARPDEIPASNWQREWRDAITDPRELLDLLGLPGLIDRVLPTGRGDPGSSFPLRVPRAFVDRMRPGDPDDPLLRQVLPLRVEQDVVQGFSIDAVGDLDARAGGGVLRKYDGRALLVATGSCAVHCRYCFRRHFPYAEETAAANRWAEALETIAADPAIDELLLSGGDPLSLSTAKLAELTERARHIPHLERLRIHTRLPVVLPSRVDAALVDWLSSLPWPVAIVLHANHANELDGEVAHAVARLRATGAIVLNQAVLLRGVNDTLEAQVALAESSFAIGMLPYYLHLLDRVHGAAHFDVPEADAIALHARMRERLPGYLLPRLVRELRGERSKTPVPALA